MSAEVSIETREDGAALLAIDADGIRLVAQADPDLDGEQVEQAVEDLANGLDHATRFTGGGSA